MIERYEQDEKSGRLAAVTSGGLLLLNSTPDALTLKAMRDWIADCSWADLDGDDIESLSDGDVVRGVARHYEGGIQEFIRNGE